jgi:nicotinamidase-related amidase
MVNCKVALLIIDMINDLEFEGGEALLPRALAAANAIAALKRNARRCGVPVIYVNDNFGKWRSDFRALLIHCLNDGVRGRPLAEVLKPDDEDYFVLKPKHSAFHSTTLDVLLTYLGTKTLVLTGIAANFCVMFTAQDAYMREFHLLVPRDCVASPTRAEEQYALEHMAKVLKAETHASTQIDFPRLAEG